MHCSLDLERAIVPKPNDKAELRMRSVAVLNLKTGKVGEARVHSLAYLEARIDLPDLDNDEPLSNLSDVPAIQGNITVGGLFWDYENYYRLSSDGYLDQSEQPP